MARNIHISPAINVNNTSIKIELTSLNFNFIKTKSDGGDIRFFDLYGNELQYHIESWEYLIRAIIWVNIPMSGTDTIIMTYGNQLLTYNGSPNFFLSYDNFDKGVIDNVRWTYTGNVVVSGTEAIVPGYSKLLSTRLYSSHLVRFYAKLVHSTTSDEAVAGLYNWADDTQMTFVELSDQTHFIRVKNNNVVISTTPTNDINSNYNVYEIRYIAGNYVSFYINDVLKATVMNSDITPIPTSGIQLMFLSTGTTNPAITYIDWIETIPYDVNRTITIGNELDCSPLYCSLEIVT